MKVAHISYSDMNGGAARAGYRLHQALRENGIDSQMYVANKRSTDPWVFGPTTPYERLLASMAPRVVSGVARLVCGTARNYRSFGIARTGIGIRCQYARPDIIQLHWIGNETISIEEIGEIETPLVWRLADMWPFCGAEHYTDTPEQFYDSKNRCLDPLPSRLKLSDQWVWNRKRRAWRNPINVVCTSEWMRERVRKSWLFSSNRVSVLPNCLDTRAWRPIDKQIARKELSVPEGQRILVFGASGGIMDLRKGGDLLKRSLVELYQAGERNLRLIVFGQVTSGEDYPFPCTFLGHLDDDAELIKAYSAADVMIVPSRQESFGQTASESLACGTPVVAFAVGGLQEIVDHRVNGYLASPFDCSDLAAGISWALENRGGVLSSAARRKAVDTYDNAIISRKYSALYASILSNHEQLGNGKR